MKQSTTGPLTPMKPGVRRYRRRLPFQTPLLALAGGLLVIGLGPLGSVSGATDAAFAEEPVQRARSGRGHSVHRRGHRGHHRTRHFRVGFGYGYGYSPFYSYGWGYPWWGWGGPRVVIASEGDWEGYNYGALDLDVRPEKAAVWVDGKHVGVADNYDGWPRYLWLEEGEYRLVFVHEGFETVARDYKVRAGVVLEIDAKMTPGTATPAEDHYTPVEEARQRAQAEAPADQEDRVWKWRQREARRSESGTDQSDDWRNRRSERRGDSDAADVPLDTRDFRAEPAFLELDVEPEDAAVYLDGRHLGSVAELAALRQGLIIDPGDHVVEIVRPGYQSERLEFSAESGEEVELEAELDRQ